MSIWNKYPYSTMHELNLDWIIQMIKDLTGEVESFKVINKITFFGDWDITKQYPAWSIVNVGLADGYISIRPVPAGVDYTNNDYWVHVANYSALYADMQNRIIALENAVGDNTTGLVKDVSDLQSDVSDLQTDVSTNTTNIIHNGGGSAVFCGDSYSDISTGYTHALPYYIDEIMHFSSYKNKAIAGAGFVNGYGTQENFSGQLDAAISEMTVDERLEVSYVFALGGQNDYGHTVADLQTWLSDFITKAKTNFPNAKVVILPLWYNRALSTYNVLRYQIIYTQALYSECITDCMSWAYLINTTVSFMPDGVHPLETSLPYLAACISTALKGGNAIPPVDGYGVATFLTDNLDISWSIKSSYVDTARNVHIKFVCTIGATGITANTPIIKVNDVYKPSGTIFNQINSLDGTQHFMMQLTNTGDYLCANTLNAGIYIVNLEYSLYRDNQA